MILHGMDVGMGVCLCEESVRISEVSFLFFLGDDDDDDDDDGIASRNFYSDPVRDGERIHLFI